MILDSSYLDQAINDAGSYLSYIQRIPFMLKPWNQVQIQEKIAKKRNELVGEKYFEKWEKEIERKASRESEFRDLRNFVLAHYGGGKRECVCCGEKQLFFFNVRSCK